MTTAGGPSDVRGEQRQGDAAGGVLERSRVACGGAGLQMPEAVIGVSRSPADAASDEYCNNVQSVEAAFKRFHAVSVEELSHDPSDLLGFFVDEDPADDAPPAGPDDDNEWSSSENAAAQLPPKVLVDGLHTFEQSIIDMFYSDLLLRKVRRLRVR